MHDEHDDPQQQASVLDGIGSLLTQQSIPSIARKWIDDLTGSYLLHHPPPATESSYPSPPFGAQLSIFGIPEQGARSRVEIQIKIGLALRVNGKPPLNWAYLRIDEQLIVRDVVKESQGELWSASTVLDLSARIFCASDPDKQLSVCAKCIERERKRLMRRRPAGKDAEEDKLDVGRMAAIEDPSKLFVINTGRVLDFAKGEVILPSRIKCYCRHHGEKEGFKIHFVLKDHAGKVVAETVTPSIMITDGHKSVRPRQLREEGLDGGPMRPSVQRPLFTPYMSRKASSHTQIETSDAWFNQLELDALSMPGVHGDRVASGSVSPLLLHSSAQEASKGMQRTSSASIAASPVLALPAAGLLNPSPAWQPSILRVVPNQGPIQGGIEVTLLGSGFYPGMTCMFGTLAAIPTQCWSPNTLICILPPSTVAGPVPVYIQDYAVESEDAFSPMFTYIDETERSLMELALQIVGLKMTGQLNEARQVAMQIVKDSTGQPSSPDASVDGKQHTAQLVLDALRRLQQASQLNTEDLCIKDKTGHSLLHYAASANLYDLTEFLLQSLVPTDDEDACGYTPLHFAALGGHEYVIELLLDAGANVFAETNQGELAIDLALRTTHTFTVQQLHTAMLVEDADPFPQDPNMFSIELPRWFHKTIATLQAGKEEAQHLINYYSPNLGITQLGIPNLGITNALPDYIRIDMWNTVLPWWNDTQEQERDKSTGLMPIPHEQVAAREAELRARRRERDRIIFLFWLPMLIGMVALALFRFKVFGSSDSYVQQQEPQEPVVIRV